MKCLRWRGSILLCAMVMQEEAGIAHACIWADFNLHRFPPKPKNLIPCPLTPDINMPSTEQVSGFFVVTRDNCPGQPKQPLQPNPCSRTTFHNHWLPILSFLRLPGLYHGGHSEIVMGSPVLWFLPSSLSCRLHSSVLEQCVCCSQKMLDKWGGVCWRSWKNLQCRRWDRSVMWSGKQPRAKAVMGEWGGRGGEEGS